MIVTSSFASFLLYLDHPSFLKDFYYLEPMGNGKVNLIIDEASEWYDTTEGSLGEKIRQFVCNY